MNSLDCSFISKQFVLDTIRKLRLVTLVVRRKKPASPPQGLFTTHFQLKNGDHGISLESGQYIKKITPGSLAANDGNLNVGDRVLSVSKYLNHRLIIYF